MNRIAALVLLVVAAVGAQTHAAEVEGIIAGPYVQFATKSSIVILWETAEDATTLVEYDEAQFLKEETTPIPLTRKSTLTGTCTMHEVVLTGLKPEREYLYRVSSTLKDGKVLTSDIYTFKTAVNDSTAYTFGYVSDTQNNIPVWGKIAQLLFNERPNFVLHGGDIVGNGKKKEEWLNEFLKPGHVLMSRIPMYAAIGNHENNHDHYYQYMANPAPEDYYTFTYGNAQIFIIDDNKDLAPGSVQRAWLERELAASKAKWKFAVHHHPPFNSDEDDYGNTWRGASTYGDVDVRTIVPLYERYGVDIVFNGHIHDYERTFPVVGNRTVEEGGVVYVTAGGGGGGLENYSPNRSWFTAKVRRDHHFVLVSVNGGTLQLQAIDQNWQLFDTYTITK